MQDFSDTNKDKTTIIEKLKNAPTFKEILIIIQEVYPNWIIGTLENFSKDYPTLNSNWNKICEDFKVKPAKILLVEEVNFDEDYKLIRVFSDLLTRMGFNIKHKNHLVSCPKCMSAIPTKICYELMKDNNFDIPEKWSSNCNNC